MRPNANSRRPRGRSGRKFGNPRNQIFDSNGPGARVRGNASQIYEKYQQLARDASSAGDRVGAENYLQHAEHYYRLVNASAARNEQRNTPPGNGADEGVARTVGAAAPEEGAARAGAGGETPGGGDAGKRRARKPNGREAAAESDADAAEATDADTAPA